MRVTRNLTRSAVLAGGVIGVVAAVAPRSRPGLAVRRALARVAREARYYVASAPGIAYRLAGGRPDPNVSDDVLADRVRSSVGPLVKRLDLPRVHVMVDGHVVILHGEVDSEGDAHAIEEAVRGVSGVRGVESHLHLGLVRGDTRPSAGRAVSPTSGALTTLLDTASRAGAQEPRHAVHAVLCGFGDRLPPDEWAQVLTHLPDDVRVLAGPPRRHGEPVPRLKTIPQLVAAVVGEGGIAPEPAEAITRAVIGTLRALVPEEAGDVAAVLPAELRAMWESETAAR